MYRRDTIAAIATPPGEGGIAIIRVSGPTAATVARNLFSPYPNGGLSSHRFYYGRIGTSAGMLDEVLMVLMQAPRSYTREDVLEIHCHGGFLVAHQVLAAVLGEGVRLAEAGEFTKRAFLNGRLDLAQAEAVIDIIRSKSETALQLAQAQYAGRLSGALQAIRTRLQHQLMLVEAAIDFADDEVPPLALTALQDELAALAAELATLVASFQSGCRYRDGVRVAIVGKPNVGKSSLLNALLREARAIVTAIPGTTRDVIEEVLTIDGLPVVLLDTAGLRETADPVERLGVERSRATLERADLVLLVLDNSRPFDAEDEAVFAGVAGKAVLLVRNKVDLPGQLQLPAGLPDWPAVDMVAASGAGVQELETAIFRLFVSGAARDSREQALLTTARHRDILARCLQALEDCRQAVLDGLAPEYLAVHLREALQAVGEVTGETTPEDILDLLFSSFCIGK